MAGLVAGMATKPLAAIVTSLALPTADVPPAPPPPATAQVQSNTCKAASYPALTEESWAFKSGNSVYFIGKQTGTVLTTTLQPNEKTDSVSYNK